MRRPIVKTTCLCALACVAMAAAAVAPAAADSLTFIKNNNIWLANPGRVGPVPGYVRRHRGIAVRVSLAVRRRHHRGHPADGGPAPPDLPHEPERTAVERADRHAGAGHGRDGRQGVANGALVAYWFETLVNDQLCSFCVSIARTGRCSPIGPLHPPRGDRHAQHRRLALLDRQRHDRVDERQRGALVLPARDGRRGRMVQRRRVHRRGRASRRSLDAEVAPTGDRLAVVRGNHQETIRFLELNGPPPAAPTPIAGCWFTSRAAGSSTPPGQATESRSPGRRTTAIWLGEPRRPELPAARPELVIPGAGEPDLSPAAINPDPRPACANPGNPTICEEIAAPHANGLSGAQLDRAAFSARSPASPGTPRARLRASRSAGCCASARSESRSRARRRHARRPPHHHWHLRPSRDRARRRPARLHGRRQREARDQLTAQGRKRLRRARRKATLKVSFTPSGARAISTTARSGSSDETRNESNGFALPSAAALPIACGL